MAPTTRTGRRPLRHVQGGFTVVLLMLVVAIVAAQLLAASYGWLIASRRAKERELFFRGEQYQSALVSYVAQPPHEHPRELSDLLDDRRSGTLKRHLRDLYPDPMTDAPTLEPVRDGEGGIVGVRSTSDAWALKEFEHPRRYSEIVFRAPAAEASAVSQKVGQ